MVTERTKCPCCGRMNNNNNKVFTRDFSLLGMMTPFKEYHVWKCSSCGMVYAGDMKPTMPLNEYYKLMSKYEYCVPNDTSGDDFSRQLVEFVQECGVAKCDKIIDIGCGAGFVLRRLKLTGYENIQGLELSETNCDYLREEYDIPTILGGIGDNLRELKRNCYDLVIIKGVLEHLMDLHKSVDFCEELLSSDGKLLIACPDTDSFRYFDDCYQQFSVEHINYFDTHSMVDLCSRHNLKLVEKKEVGIYKPGARSECTMWIFDRGQSTQSIETKSDDSLRQYLEQSEIKLEKIKEKFDSYNINKEIILWGTGTLSSTLFQFGILTEEMIKIIVDSNSNYHGKEAYGHIIQDPSVLLSGVTGSILVATQTAFEAVISQIGEMGLPNNVLNIFE